MLAFTAAMAALAAIAAAPIALADTASSKLPAAVVAHKHADAGAGGHDNHPHPHHKHHRHNRHHRRHHRRHWRNRHHVKHRRHSHRATPASFDCANANLTPTADNLTEVRAATLCLIDRERLAHGERPLQLNGRLEQAAQGHTKDMVSEDYFSHYGPSGEGPASRMKAAGYIYSSNIGYEVGENIAWGTQYMATPSAIVEAWMQSPGHRENILDPRFKNTAIGVLAALPRSYGKGEQGAIYTQDFGVIIAG
jgi:uncharacterized protein YkwD